MKSNSHAFATLHIATIILAMGPILFRLAEGFSPPGYLFWRFFIAIVLFGLLIKSRDLKRLHRANRSELSLLLLSGGLYGLGAWISFEALSRTSVAFAMIAIFTYPVFTALFQPMFTGIKLKKKDIQAGLLVIIGISSMAPITQVSTQDLVGIGLGLLSAVCFGLDMCISKLNVSNGFSSSSINVIRFGTLVIGFSPFAVGSFQTLINGNIHLVFLAALVTVIGHFSFIHCLKKLTPTTLSVVGSLQPIYSAVFAFLILSEILTIRIGIAAALLSIAVWIQQKQ